MGRDLYNPEAIDKVAQIWDRFSTDLISILENGAISFEDIRDQLIIRGYYLDERSMSIFANLDTGMINMKDIIRDASSKVELIVSPADLVDFINGDDTFIQPLLRNIQIQIFSHAVYHMVIGMLGDPLQKFDLKNDTDYELSSLVRINLRDVMLGHKLPKDVIAELKDSKVRFFIEGNLLRCTVDSEGTNTQTPES
jgi:hypothetical protein